MAANVGLIKIFIDEYAHSLVPRPHPLPPQKNKTKRERGLVAFPCIFC